MLRIQRRFVESVQAATTPEDLYELVRAAIRLEHSTIPPYLTAMMSLKPGMNREIWSVIHSVVIDEMLHMTIACNLLNALGGRPQINVPDFVPTYPGPLPLGIDGGLNVGLEPFAIDLVKNIFMEIEEPENPIVFPQELADAAQFATIGQFYEAVIDKIQQLGEGIFIGDPARQVIMDTWFAPTRLFPITDVASAVRALKVVVQEGEGTPVSPFAVSGELAHYYRFEEIFFRRRLVPDATSPNGFSFTGPAVPFDPSGVYPLTRNQKLAELDPSTEAGRRARQFSFVYTKLLNTLQQTFDGEPTAFTAALGLMFELKLAGQILCALPVIKNNTPTGLNAGPTFEYQPENS